MILIYDKTFEGFLSLIYEVYYKKLKVEEILKEQPKTLILNEIYQIKTDEKKAQKVFKALKDKFPKKSFELVLNIFMCDSKNFEMFLLNYIILGFKNKNELFNITNQEVFFLQNLQKELFHLVHKMYGFLRFQELQDGTLYGKIDTKFNILFFLGKHFSKRLNNQNFIIHDIKRQLAFIKNANNKTIEEVSFFEEPKFSENEKKFNLLWNTFFQAASIKERKNLKCQQNFVPLLYRTYMTEFVN